MSHSLSEVPRLSDSGTVTLLPGIGSRGTVWHTETVQTMLQMIAVRDKMMTQFVSSRSSIMHFSWSSSRPLEKGRWLQMSAVRGPLVALSKAAEALVAFSEARVMFRVTFLLRVLHFALRFPRRIWKSGEEISCHVSGAGTG